MTSHDHTEPKLKFSVRSGGRKMSLSKRIIVIASIIFVLVVAVGFIPQKADSENQNTITTTTIQEEKQFENSLDKSIAVLSHNADVEKVYKTIWINNTNQKLWYEKAAAIEAEKQRQAAIAAQKKKEQEQAKIAQQKQQAPAQQTNSGPATGRCGGDLPPCYVMMRESRGIITARNPSSTASGKWQFLNSTWAGFGGYAEAWMAPESVQDAKARILWDGGRGCSHWSAC